MMAYSKMKKHTSFSIASLIMLVIANACTSENLLSSTPTPTFTSTPTSTPIPQITQTLTPTSIVQPVHGYNVLLSPDGTKKAIYDAHSSRTFQVIDKNGGVLWSITYDLNKFNVGDYNSTLVEAWYKPFYWSKDGKFLYYTCFHGQEIDTSGKFWGNEFIDGCGVFQLNLESGETIDILPEIHPGNGYYAFSISPDENYLVYTYQNVSPVQIKLLDINTSKERVLLTAGEDILETGRYGWSPQGDKLTFMTLKIAEDETRIYSIFTLDISSLETKLIIENFDTRIRFVSWKDEGVISYEPDTGGVIWQLSIDSKTFSISTMTPPAEFMSTPTP